MRRGPACAAPAVRLAVRQAVPLVVRLGVALMAALMVVLAVAGCGTPRPVPVPTLATPVPGWSAVRGQAAVVSPPVRHAEPVAVSIPAIGVRSALERLRLDAAGVMVPPVDAAVAGWYAAGVRPGDPGPAVIAGHLDSRTGPGVFARLGRLKRGDAVHVELADGRRVRFLVDDVRAYPKAEFPTHAVYGPTFGPQLRLITCGGMFDRGRGHYPDNVIAFASPG
ncbi:class F sortase [Acrocarpospora phusangensis]|uniref:Class F sortase n=1 Tax=Acrocarpospora phusangensis TaxID=1070424 RepID=A0A919QAL4_9ACTN|nr:class F sortase [Acrocarpospora phusangensis]GIH23820.1 class F sortase [Acrocarpospora phusangensis]